MSFELPAEALQWRKKVRVFVDSELQPLELEAEMNEGRISKDLRLRHEKFAIDAGITLMDTPKSLGGLALPLLTQVAIVEQFGRVTNALGWCYGEVQSWMFEACNADQVKRYILPTTRGEVHLCYAISEEDAGSDPERHQDHGHSPGRSLSCLRRKMACHQLQPGQHDDFAGQVAKRQALPVFLSDQFTGRSR